MAIFYVMFALLGTLFLFTKSNKGRVAICILGFMILWLVQALRATQVGHDACFTYIPAFQEISKHGFESLISGDARYYFEIGYQFYMKFISEVTTSPNVFLAITAFFVLAPIAFIIYKYSKNPALSFVIFAGLILYHFSFSGLRQALAISICFLSYKAIVDRRFLWFAFGVVLASLFHKSAILFFPAYFLYKLNVNYKTLFFTLVAVVLLYLFVQPIAEYIRVLLFGATKYSKYISTAGGALGLTMLYLLLTLFIYLLMDRKNQKQTSLFWFAVMVLLFQSLSLLSEAADRVGYYYLIFYCISLPNILEESPKFDITVKRVIALLFYLFFIAFFIYCNAGGYLEVVPYKFYWQQ